MNKIKRLFIAAVLISLVAVLFSFVMGAAFGINEEALKTDLQTRAYNSIPDDEAKANKLADKSWRYYQRAHLHGGVLGGISLGFALVLYLFDARRNTGIASLAFSMGALGYGVFWLLAGMYAPTLGSTSAAKEMWGPVAIPSTGLLLLSLVFGIWGLYGALRRA